MGNAVPLAVSRAADGFDGLARSESESGVALVLGLSAESHVAGLNGESVVDLGHRAAVDGLDQRPPSRHSVVIRLTPVANSIPAGQMSVTLLPKMRWLLDEMTVSPIARAGQSAEKTALHPHSFLRASDLKRTSSWPLWAKNVAVLGTVFPWNPSAGWRWMPLLLLPS